MSTNRALFVSELLAIILNFSDLQTKGRCARVSRSWCPIALDSLWHTLSSVVPLLQLLGDFTYREEGRGPDRRSCLTYTLPPTQKEWTRFQVYASRVKSMAFSNDSRHWHNGQFAAGRKDFSRSIFAEIGMRRRTSSVLPNLTSLRIDASEDIALISYSVIFFGNKIKDLSVVLDCRSLSFANLERRRLDNFFEDVVALIPHLEVFKLRGFVVDMFELDFHDELLSRFLPSFQSLKRVEFCSRVMSPSVLETLSALPRLQSVRLNCEITDRSQDLGTRLPCGAFPKLVELWLPIRPEEASTITVTLDNVFRNLTTLFIGMSEALTMTATQQLFDGISKTCSRLVSLMIFTNTNPVEEQENGEWEDSFAVDLDPIFDLADLKELTLSFHRVLFMSDYDLETLLANRRPSLEVFHLTWTPIGEECPNLSIDAVPIILHHCPKLRSLSLAVNFEEIAFPTYNIPLTHMVSLNFGLSPLTKRAITPVALFLESVFGDSLSFLSITACLHVPQFGAHVKTWDKEEQDQIEKLTSRWEEVGRIIRAIRHTNVERDRLRARINELEGRIEKYERNSALP